MNILYFAHDNRIGGATLSLLGMIDELKEENQIYVVVPIKKGFLVDELRKRDISVYHRHYFWWMLAQAKTPVGTFIKKIIYKILCFNNYFCAFSLKKIVKMNKIDIIHTNSSVINTGGILSTMTGVPHVWHIREFSQEDFNFFTVWKYKKLCSFMNSHSDKVIAISRAIAVKFQDKIASDKLEIVYNGVSEENKKYKSEIKDKNDTIEYLISGSIGTQKGQEAAIQAVALLVKRGYSNLHLSIAGAGDTRHLEKLINEENLTYYISLLGIVKDMPALRKRMDVELVCSACEAFGRVTVEAMMSSNPVIGSNAGGTPELIQNGVTGYLYQHGNVQELADKMEILLKCPEEIRKLGENAYHYAAEKFTAEKNAARIMEIYEEVL